MQSVALPRAGEPSVRMPMHLASQRTRQVGLRCPACTGNLASMAYQALAEAHEPIECRACSAIVSQERGVWMALAKERHQYFRRFIKDYETVRKAEGRGSDDPEFYLDLPYHDRTRRNSSQWAIRARTYKYIEQKIVPPKSASGSQSLTILDLGAGNGWLSYRLAVLGHRPIAVDLQTNSFDGLGAAAHYERALPMLFPRFQAEIDRLPFSNGQFDVAIFNASFHYSENYDNTLTEVIRCLRPGGTVVIADTPSYSGELQGQKMIEERSVFFKDRFGFASDSLASCEFLTRERLETLEERHGVKWTTHKVWYGFRWAFRPLVRKVRRRREPSQFRIYTAQVKNI